MVPGCDACYCAVITANMQLATRGEGWLITTKNGHCHSDQIKEGEEAHLSHLTRG